MNEEYMCLEERKRKRRGSYGEMNEGYPKKTHQMLTICNAFCHWILCLPSLSVSFIVHLMLCVLSLKMSHKLHSK